MKILKPLGILLSSILLLATSCKKTDATDNEAETSFALTANGAITENFIEDASDVKDEALTERDLVGNFGPAGPETILGCAVVTVTPQSGFPKTILIDFGTGCTGPNGVLRSGKIQVVISDSIRRPGSTAVMSFDNYFVNAHHIEGTITWTNTTTGIQRAWRRDVVNLKTTAPGGRFWTYNSVRNITQTEGNGTPRNRLDDIFIISGNGSVTNASGVSRTNRILIELRKKVSCDNIDRGTIRFEGPSNYALLDFGDGTCDNLATISINGGTPRTIILR
ncbi:MAG: hypothetical protein ABIT96_03605 [Ferruginibacter sp.]